MIHFEETDRRAWLAFLNTPEGAKGIAFLREQKRPTIRPSGLPHEMQFDLGLQGGFDRGIHEVEQLARVPAEKKLQTADRPPLQSTRRQ